MPRSKIKRESKISFENVKPTKAKLKQESINCFFRAIEDESKIREERIAAEYERIVLKINSSFSEITMKIPHQNLGKTIAELQKEPVEVSTLETISHKSVDVNATRLARSRLNNHSTASKNELSLLRSKLCSNIKKAKYTGRASRSLSRSKLQQVAQTTLNSYKTPLQKTISSLYIGTVTPKVQPNTPQIVLRRPKQGEMALSMQGSPLMVSSVSSDAIANVNIPLQDGRIFTIQPQRGLRISQLPAIDLETQRQIETLRDNLNKVCARHS